MKGSLLAAFLTFSILSGAYGQTDSCSDGNITLEECRQMALDRNSSIRNAELDRLGAVERKREALWEFFPRISVIGGMFYSVDPMISIGLKDILGTSPDALALIAEMHHLAYSYGISPFFNAVDKGSLASLNIAQPVFTGGRIVNGNRLASLGVEVAALKKEVCTRDILEEVEKAWWDVISLQEKEKTLLVAEEMFDNLRKDVCSAVEAGLATPEDEMQVNVHCSDIRSKLAKLRSGMVLAKMSLCSKIGFKYCTTRAGASVDCPYIGDIVFKCKSDELLPPEKFWKDENELLVSQKEMRLLELATEAKKMERKMIVGESLPTVALGGSFGYSNFINSSINATVYATVRIPLSDWGKTSHKIRRIGYEYDKAMNDKTDCSEQLLLKIRMLWMNAVSAWDELTNAEEACSLARRQVEIAEANYHAGMVTLSQLLQARTELRQSEDNLSDSRIAYRVALSKYRDL